MTTAKTTYTYTELVKRSTTQLIAIYNRLFNTNAWDMWFNPYEHRQDMLVDLMAEMDAQTVLAKWEAQGAPVKFQKPVLIQYEQTGIVIVWREQFVVNAARKFAADTVALVRQLRADGESVDMIAKQFGMPRNRVYRICRGDVYAESL